MAKEKPGNDPTKPKKGFSLKSLIFTEDENKGNSTSATTVPIPPVAQPIADATAYQMQPVDGATAPPQYGTGTVDQDLLQKLCRVLDDSNLPGPDYLELKQSADALTMLPDPNTRFMAAYATLKVSNPTEMSKNRVTSSLDSYIKIMEDQKKQGLTEVANMRQTLVTDKQQMIQQLSEEIAERSAQISQLQSEVATGTVECNRNEMNFIATVDSVINKLKIDKETLNLIINE